jgi:SAM-dependent methyltransferase
VDDILNRELTEDSRILDAGAGRKTVINAPGHVTGFDIIEDGMAVNARLDARIVGDLHTYPFQPEYDAVICADVLEHLPTPLTALENMRRAVKPGGLLVLGFPVMWSPKGLFTKFTPLRFHIWVMRRLYSDKKAGKPGLGPFKVYMRLRPVHVERFAKKHGLEVVLWEFEEAPKNLRLRQGNRLLKALWSAVELAYRPLKKDPRNTEITVVLRAPR